MTINVGTPDRMIRLLVGLALIAAAFFSGIPLFDGTAVKYGAAAVGLVLALTAVFRFCPLYALLGIKTCRI